VAVGLNGTLLASADGAAWEAVPSGTRNNYTAWFSPSPNSWRWGVRDHPDEPGRPRLDSETAPVAWRRTCTAWLGEAGFL